MPDSAIWGDLLQAVHARLVADADISTPVFWGYDPDAEEFEAIYVGIEEDAERVPGPMAGGASLVPFDEELRCQIVIEVHKGDGPDLKTAYDRVTAIGKEVERSLRANVKLIDGTANAFLIAKTKRRFFRNGDTRGARALIDVVGDNHVRP